MKDTIIIEYNGEKLKTKHFQEISNEEFNMLKKQYYEKPNFLEVQKQILKIHEGGTKK